MKRIASFTLSLIIIVSLAAITSGTVYAASEEAQLGWIIDAARGNGEFSFEFTTDNGQTGIVEGKDGKVRVYRDMGSAVFQEQTNHAVMANFGRHFRMITQREGAGDPMELPEFIGEANGTLSFVSLPLGGDAMTFVFDSGEMTAAFFNNTWIKIDSLKNTLSGVTPATFSTKTTLWWIIDAARGEGAFNFDYELEDGTKGKVIGDNGDVKVYRQNDGNTYTETPASPVAKAFAKNFNLLTQQGHNHNNEVDGVRPFEPEFPEWLGLTNNGVGFINGNYELFPLVSRTALDSAANRFDLNIAPADRGNPIDRLNDMLFIYETASGTTPVMSAAYFDGVWMKISNLQNNTGGAFSVTALPEVALTATRTGSQVVYAGEVKAGQNAMVMTANGLEFITGAVIGADGNATFNLSQAGDYVILVQKTGDVTGTGSVTIADALLVLQHAMGTIELDARGQFAASGGRESVNTADALNVLKLAVG
jgi:hypothetical protein